MSNLDYLVGRIQVILERETNSKKKQLDSLLKQAQVKADGGTWSPKEMSREVLQIIIDKGINEADEMEQILEAIKEYYKTGAK